MSDPWADVRGRLVPHYVGSEVDARADIERLLADADALKAELEAEIESRTKWAEAWKTAQAELEAWIEKDALFVEQGDRLSKMEEALEIERLATIEHSQWMAWARTLMDEEPGLSEERRERWQELMVDYSELPDEIKDYDREWALIVIGEALAGESR